MATIDGIEGLFVERMTHTFMDDGHGQHGRNGYRKRLFCPLSPCPYVRHLLSLLTVS